MESTHPIQFRTSLQVELIEDDNTPPAAMNYSPSDPNYVDIKNKYFNRLHLNAPRAGRVKPPVVSRVSNVIEIPSSSSTPAYSSHVLIAQPFSHIIGGSPPINIPSATNQPPVKKTQAAKDREQFPMSLPSCTPPSETPPRWKTHFPYHTRDDEDKGFNVRTRAPRAVASGHHHHHHESYEDGGADGGLTSHFSDFGPPSLDTKPESGIDYFDEEDGDYFEPEADGGVSDQTKPFEAYFYESPSRMH